MIIYFFLKNDLKYNLILDIEIKIENRSFDRCYTWQMSLQIIYFIYYLLNLIYYNNWFV